MNREKNKGEEKIANKEDVARRL